MAVVPLPMAEPAGCSASVLHCAVQRIFIYYSESRAQPSAQLKKVSLSNTGRPTEYRRAQQRQAQWDLLQCSTAECRSGQPNINQPTESTAVSGQPRQSNKATGPLMADSALHFAETTRQNE